MHGLGARRAEVLELLDEGLLADIAARLEAAVVASSTSLDDLMGFAARNREDFERLGDAFRESGGRVDAASIAAFKEIHGKIADARVRYAALQAETVGSIYNRVVLLPMMDRERVIQRQIRLFLSFRDPPV
jgi:hypothetical protein